MRRALVLVSGGLDSATVLALAKEQGYQCYALSFDYGQRHRFELEAAHKVVHSIGVVEHRVMNIGLDDIGGSALTDTKIPVPDAPAEGIPVTYVPARNTVFLSLALAWAEVLEARDIFIGVNAVDFSGYPDCRPAYIAAFEAMAKLATRSGIEGDPVTIQTPLINMSKKEIISRGVELGLDYALTISCYAPDATGRACGVCDSCQLRRTGFREACIPDPTQYQE